MQVWAPPTYTLDKSAARTWRGSGGALATTEMEHAKKLSTNQASAREKRFVKFAAKGATQAQVQLPPPLPLPWQLPSLPRVPANAPRVLPLRPVERQHRQTAPFVHSVRRVKSQVLTPLSTSAAVSKKSGALSASQLLQMLCCVGLACFVIIVLLIPVGMAVVARQNGGPTSETVRDCRDDPSCRRDAHLPPLLHVNRTPLQNRTSRPHAAMQNSLRRQLPARTPRAVGTRLSKAPTKTPIIPTSNEHKALIGTSCTNPMQRDRSSKSKQLPVIIFTHLRRTGGSVLEKGVFWPGVACDQGVVPPPPPSPSSPRPRSVHRATPGGRLFYQAEVSNKPLPTQSLSERRSIQQARDSLLASVLFNCHEGSVGRFASASVNERLKFASKMRRAALVWRHCPYGVHALLPGGKMATAQTGQAAQTAQMAQVAPHRSSSQVVQDRVQDRVQELRARADGTGRASSTWEQRMHERQLPVLLEPRLFEPPKTFAYVTLLRDPVSQPPISPSTLPLALSLASRPRPRTRPRPRPRPCSRPNPQPSPPTRPPPALAHLALALTRWSV